VSFAIKQPETPEDFSQYYGLRYRMLRAPWGALKGSEVDDIEDECFHIMVMDNDKAVGVGRLQYNSADEAQIRYMAVDKKYERNGIGRMIVVALEQEAAKNSMPTVVLDAREPAVGFYKKLGYCIEGKSYVLFDEIQHYRMTKQI
jgi:predicted GNAT family N-acyltransferase